MADFVEVSQQRVVSTYGIGLYGAGVYGGALSLQGDKEVPRDAFWLEINE